MTGTAVSTVLVVLAYSQLAVVAIVLTVVDLTTHRLPNRIVLPSTAAGGLLLGSAAAVAGEWEPLARALVGGAALFLFYFVLAVASRQGMGFGDVKLAALLGLHLAWAGWSPLIVGAAAAFLLGGIFSLLLVLARRATRSTRIPFGPWMIAGAVLGMTLGESLGG